MPSVNDPEFVNALTEGDPPRRPMRCVVLAGREKLLCLAALLACVPVCTAAGPPPAPLCGNGPLDILLTNDDGFDAAGIRALYARLGEAGHRVLLVGPARNASGSSTSFTWTPVTVTRDAQDPNVYAVGATPATAVVLGATALFPPGRRPDLVVSGINDGANTGTLLALSGTIGATLAGTLLLDPPVPGLAVSADRPGGRGSREPWPAGHLDGIARDVTRIVAAARGWFCERGRVVRATTVLNVNYPARPLPEMRGTRLASQGRTTDLHIAFEAAGDQKYALQRVIAPAAEDVRDSDDVLLEQGYVTVTPVDAHLEDRAAPRRDLQRRLAR